MEMRAAGRLSCRVTTAGVRVCSERHVGWERTIFAAKKHNSSPSQSRKRWRSSSRKGLPFFLRNALRRQCWFFRIEKSAVFLTQWNSPMFICDSRKIAITFANMVADTFARAAEASFAKMAVVWWKHLRSPLGIFRDWFPKDIAIRPQRLWQLACKHYRNWLANANIIGIDLRKKSPMVRKWLSQIANGLQKKL